MNTARNANPKEVHFLDTGITRLLQTFSMSLALPPLSGSSTGRRNYNEGENRDGKDHHRVHTVLWLGGKRDGWWADNRVHARGEWRRALTRAMSRNGPPVRALAFALSPRIAIDHAEEISRNRSLKVFFRSVKQVASSQRSIRSVHRLKLNRTWKENITEMRTPSHSLCSSALPAAILAQPQSRSPIKKAAHESRLGPARSTLWKKQAQGLWSTSVFQLRRASASQEFEDFRNTWTRHPSKKKDSRSSAASPAFPPPPLGSLPGGKANRFISLGSDIDAHFRKLHKKPRRRLGMSRLIEGRAPVMVKVTIPGVPLNIMAGACP